MRACPSVQAQAQSSLLCAAARVPDSALRPAPHPASFPTIQAPPTPARQPPAQRRSPSPARWTHRPDRPRRCSTALPAPPPAVLPPAEDEPCAPRSAPVETRSGLRRSAAPVPPLRSLPPQIHAAQPRASPERQTRKAPWHDQAHEKCAQSPALAVVPACPAPSELQIPAHPLQSRVSPVPSSPAPASAQTQARQSALPTAPLAVNRFAVRTAARPHRPVRGPASPPLLQPSRSKLYAEQQRAAHRQRMQPLQCCQVPLAQRPAPPARHATLPPRQPLQRGLRRPASRYSWAHSRSARPHVPRPQRRGCPPPAVPPAQLPARPAKEPCGSGARQRAGSLPASTGRRDSGGWAMCSKLLYPFGASVDPVCRSSGSHPAGEPSGRMQALFQIMRWSLRGENWAQPIAVLTREPAKGKINPTFVCCQSHSVRVPFSNDRL